MRKSEFKEISSNNFDFLRLLAATLVLVSHCYPLFGRGDQEFISRLVGFQTGGGIAVSIFFFISGYLLTGSLGQKPDLWKFIAARALRILPALAGVVLLSVLVLGLQLTNLPLDEYLRAPRTLSYLGNIFVFPLQFDLPGVFVGAPDPGVNGSLWTLPIEVAMYAVLTVLYAAGGLRRSLAPLIAVAFFAAFVLSQTYWQWNWSNHGPVFLSIPLYNFFELGVWFFIGSAFNLYREQIAVSHTMALAVLIVLIASLWSPGVQIASIIAISYLTWYIAFCPLPLWRITAPIGDISYGVYLYAFPVQQAVYDLARDRLDFFEMMAVSLVVTYVLAFLSWRLIERPMLALKPR